MKIVFTDHARLRAGKRHISENWIIETLERPNIVTKGRDNKQIAYKEFNGKVVEVVFVEEYDRKIIISVRWGG